MPVELVIVRHGETEWTLSGRHTGVTDLPLTPHGRRQAAALRPVLEAVLRGQLPVAYTSPRQRAIRTAELALPAAPTVVDPRIAEFDYGSYEGLTHDQILQLNPTWDIWRDGCPGGESSADAGARADQCLRDYAAPSRRGPIVLFSHGHFSRILTARALGLAPEAGRIFGTATAAVSVVGEYRGEPCIELWNASADLASDIVAAAPAASDPGARGGSLGRQP